MRKRTVIIAMAALLVLCVVGISGYLMNRDTVRVTDAISGKPIQGAKVYPIYPSFQGAYYETDKRGIAHIGGFGLPKGGYGVQVVASGYQTNFIGTYPTSENHNAWQGHHMDILLQPVTK